jgi:hypothetical protein
MQNKVCIGRVPLAAEGAGWALLRRGWTGGWQLEEAREEAMAKMHEGGYIR